MKRYIKTTIFLSAVLFSFVSLFANDAAVRVALFTGDGTGASSEQLMAACEADKDRKFVVSKITAEEISKGKLADYDVLIHPGGSGSKQGRALGEQGRKAVRDFVRGGGGYLGVCAGAYLATNDYDWSLNLIDAKVVDRRHWARGKGMVKLQLSPAGTKFFKADNGELEVYYAQGPLLGRREWDNPDIPNYESLAIYGTEIAKNGAPRGIMARTSAAVRCDYGNGRVFCFSPHPELTDGLQHLIPLAVAWAAGNQ